MNKKKLSASNLSRILRAKSISTDFISKLKISYRPYICPFDDVLKEVGMNKSIFDIGCGSGMFLCLCAEFLSPKKLGGIEISNKLVSNARTILSGYKVPVTIKTYDGKFVPDNIKDYDTVTLIDVLHHIPTDLQLNFLVDLIGKLSNGTKLIIKDIDLDSKFVIFNKLHDKIFSGEESMELSATSLKEILVEKGIKLKICIRKEFLFILTTLLF